MREERPDQSRAHVQAIYIDPRLSKDAIVAWSAAMDTAFGHRESKGARDALNARWPRLQVLFFSPDAVDSAIEETVTSVYPLLLVVAAAALICAFVLVAMYTPGGALPRVALAMAGLVSVLLSVGAGLGFSLFIGIPFTNVTLVLPFILLGVGVDDIFMLVRVDLVRLRLCVLWPPGICMLAALHNARLSPPPLRALLCARKRKRYPRLIAVPALQKVAIRVQVQSVNDVDERTPGLPLQVRTHAARLSKLSALMAARCS